MHSSHANLDWYGRQATTPFLAIQQCTLLQVLTTIHAQQFANALTNGNHQTDNNRGSGY